jgi:outer membrane protein assembly factor BamB
MKNANPMVGVLVGCAILLGTNGVRAQDWPQWRGVNRDAKVTGFKAPKAWPKELTQKWKVPVGAGVATPALVGDKLYVFVREEGNEVIRCLDAANGKEVWQDKYEATAPKRPGSGFNNEFIGPRSSPTVTDGKVVIYGTSGILTCYDAANGKKLWRKDDFKGSLPRFSTSSSPLVANGMCIAQLGGESKGGIIAYELATGNEKWKWTGDGTAYASPVLLTLGDAKELVAETDKSIVGIGVAEGKLLWQVPFAVQGRGGYNACTPMVDGQTVVFSGSARGTKAVKIEKKDDGLEAKELWSNKENSVQFNTPVLTKDFVFGITANNKLFCLNTKDGKTAWTKDVGGGGGGGRRGPSGYGSIVDAGSVMLALTPSAQLLVFEPSGKEYKELAKYKVAEKETFAYPILSGKRLFVKDRDSLILWTIE